MDTDRDTASLRLDDQLCFAVYACAREIIKLYHPHLAALGLTYTQYITMMALWEHTTLSAKALGNALYLDSGTLTPLLKKLEHMGVIERKRNPEDERSLIVSLTEQGRALKEKAAGIPSKIACATNLPAHEALFLRESLKGLLQKIHACG